MDDEDLAEAEEARKLQTTGSFAGLGAPAGQASQPDAIMDILRPSGETMGVKLLKKMGWRDGQGVGPKVKRQARDDEEQDMQNGGSQEIHSFAPDDSGMIAFTKKLDRKGLGFEGEQKLGEGDIPADKSRSQHGQLDDGYNDLNSSPLTQGKKARKKKSERKGGFGVGILNDNGSEDEDPYAMGPQISYNRTIGGDKKKKKKIEVSRPSANPLLNDKPVFISKKAGAARSNVGFRKCHDGRLPLDGFVLSDDADQTFSSLSQENSYPPPKIPQDWKSSKTPRSTKIVTENSEYRSSAAAAAASKLSPKSRAALLGEAPLPGKSVFDFLSTGARDRIVTATNNQNLPQALDEASLQIPARPKTLSSLVPPLAREIAQTALGRGTAGWMPYAEDLTKRARYRTFLEIHAGIRPEGILPDRKPGDNNDDWVIEMKEFAHAAQIFKPMTGAMATRFTSSTSTPRLASDNVKQESDTDIAGDNAPLTKPNGKVKTPAEEAAAVGMYGPLTRSAQNFYPTRLLCKRFNIQPPVHVQIDPGGGPSTTDTGRTSGDSSIPQTRSTALPQKSLELVGKKDMNDLRMTGLGMRDSLGMQETQVEMSLQNTETVNLGQDERAESTVIDPERNEALEKERPGDAVFKAIFGSDSEDE